MYFIDANSVEDINLELGDSPGIFNIVICGELTEIYLHEIDNATYLHIETGEVADPRIELAVEIHPTGGLIPNAQDLTFLGTAFAGIYVWHIFYCFRTVDKRDIGTADLYTIYKEPLNDVGDTEIQVSSENVTVLHIGKQGGQSYVWFLFRIAFGDVSVIKVSSDGHSFSHVVEVLQ